MLDDPCDKLNVDANPESFGWVSNRVVMKLLGLSRPTLQRYRSKGIIPHSRIGGNVYYRFEDIEAILENNLRTGTSPEVAK
jgi:DNA-binding transcriptional MerR regulator